MVAALRGLEGSDIAAVPGWYGKLPSLGDFASRRVEGDFIEPWDVWLGERLQALREGSGDGWLEAYLHSPPWRFLLAPGVLRGFDPTLVLAGVLLPSVDRVGRYFPLTLVASLPRLPTATGELADLLEWLHRLEDTALDALHHEWGVDALESALAGLAPPGRPGDQGAGDALVTARRELASALADGGGTVELAPAAARRDLAALIAGAIAPDAVPPARAAPAHDLRGVALWLADQPEQQRLLVSHGLPAARDFHSMFGVAGLGGTLPAAALSADAPAPASPMQPVIPDDADLLGLFDIAPAPPAASAASAFAAPPGTDVLGLFPAGSTPNDAGAEETRPGDDDILALFDAAPRGHVAAAADDKKPSEPDILDLFGATPEDKGKTI